MASFVERFKGLFQTHSTAGTGTPVSDGVSKTQEHSVDKSRFTERILETENLTDELEDVEANWLLNWGIGHLDDVLPARTAADANADDDANAVAGDKVNALMAVMRKINRIAGNYTSREPQDLIADLANLNDLYTIAFGPLETAATAAPGLAEETAARVVQMSVREVVEFLADRSQVAGFKSHSA